MEGSPDREGLEMKKLFSIISSKAFLIWLIAGWTVYYVTNAVWSEEAFAGFIGGLSKNPLLQIPYVAFLLSLALNIVRAARERLKKGFLALALWIVLPLGAFMFFGGYFLSAALRSQAQLLVGEGDTVTEGLGSPSGELYAKRISPSLKDEFLDTGEADTSAVESEGSVFAYEPKITLSDRSRDYEVGVFPARRVKGTYYHILNFGLAPGIRLLDAGGEVLKEGYLALRILPPGAEDSFELAPYRVVVRLSPERVMEKGDAQAKVFSLRSPSYRAEVYRGDERVFEGDSRVGITFDGKRLEFTEPAYWVFLEVVKDPGVPFILSGLALLLLGAILLPLRLIVKVIKA